MKLQNWLVTISDNYQNRSKYTKVSNQNTY